MPGTYGFQIGQYSANLCQNRMNQLLNATSAKEAYSTQGGGFFAFVGDYFCFGNERKTVRELFNAIVTAQGNADPIEQFSRFEKLSSYASASHSGDFKVYAYMGMRGKWGYQFDINNTTIYKSDWHTEAPEHPVRKDFCVKMTIRNIQQAVEKYNQDHPTRTRERFAVSELETLTDEPGTKAESDTIQSGEKGTSRVYLTNHLHDPFFSSTNFSEIRQVVTGGESLFDAVFNCNGEERVLRLSNRVSTNQEFRGKIAQKSFRERDYSNLSDLLSANYGTERDSELVYLVAPQFMELKNLIGEANIQGSDVYHMFNTASVTRTGAAPVSLAALLFRG